MLFAHTSTSFFYLYHTHEYIGRDLYTYRKKTTAVENKTTAVENKLKGC